MGRNCYRNRDLFSVAVFFVNFSHTKVYRYLAKVNVFRYNKHRCTGGGTNMKAAIKKIYMDLVENIDFPAVVYIYETGRIVAMNEQAGKIIGSSCKNMNLIWEDGKLKLEKDILDNGSRLYLNRKIIDGKEWKSIDIEVNCFELDQNHIVFAFIEHSYKGFFSQYLSIRVPRIFWQNTKRYFKGMNQYTREDFECDEDIEKITSIDVIGSETIAEIQQIEDLVIKNKEYRFNAIEQIYKKGEGCYFCKMSRMPLINNTGTVEGMLGVYTLILNREEYQELFNKSLKQTTILSEILGRSNLIVVTYNISDDMKIEYITSNFEMFGYELEDIYTKNIGWKQMIYEEDFEEVRKNIFLERGNEQKFRKYRVKRADGKIVWLEEEKIEEKLYAGNIYNISAMRILSEEDMYQIEKRENLEKNKAMLDFLTGLPNRHKYEIDAAEFIERAIKHGNQGYVIMFDLDDFKHINDGLSPEYGDILLKKIADTIDEIPEVQNHCYRVDGDGFLLLLDDRYEDRLEDILEELQKIFEQPWYLKEKECYCTMSMGVVSYPTYSIEPRELLKYADTAVYEAKSKGKNRVCYYREHSVEKSIDRVNYEKHLRKAIKKECVEFELYYQPIVRSSDKSVIAAEALLRWKSPELGFVTPIKFIPLSEYLGLIVPLGEYVLRKAFETCKEWNEKSREGFSISVNLSVVQLVQPNIVEHIVKIAEETEVDKSKIILEVTESLAVEDMDLMKTVLMELKKEGFKIALDDFGTGYSSLNHIMEMPLDYIKIDKSFIDSYGTSSFNPSLLSAIVELAHSMDMQIIVEGVETRQQMEFLMFLNTDRYQGYFYGKPVPKEEFLENFMREQL